MEIAKSQSGDWWDNAIIQGNVSGDVSFYILVQVFLGVWKFDNHQTEQLLMVKIGGIVWAMQKAEYIPGQEYRLIGLRKKDGGDDFTRWSESNVQSIIIGYK